MSVQLNPSEQLQFNRPFNREVCCMLAITNHNERPVAFRVKSTASKLYFVRPNSGRIEPGSSVNVQVLLQPMRQDPPLSEQCKDRLFVQSVIIPPNMEFRTPWHWWNFVVDSDKKAFQFYDQRIGVVHLPPERPIAQEASTSQTNPVADDDDTGFGLDSLFLRVPSPPPPSPTLPLPAHEVAHLSQDLDTESSMPDVIQYMPSPVRSASAPLPSQSQTHEERSPSVPVSSISVPLHTVPPVSSPNPLPAPQREREKERLPPPLRLAPPRPSWAREERIPNRERRIPAPKEKREEGSARVRGPPGRGLGFTRQRPERKMPVPVPAPVAPSPSPTPPPQLQHSDEPPQSPKLEDPGDEKIATDNEAIEPPTDEPLRQPDLAKIDVATPSSPSTPNSAPTPDPLATVVPSPASPTPPLPLWKIPTPPSSQGLDTESSAPDDDVHICSPTSSPRIPSPPASQTQEEWCPPVLIPPTPASLFIPSVPSPPPQRERERERLQSPSEVNTILVASVTHSEAIEPLKGEPLHQYEVVDVDIFMLSGPPTPDSAPIPELLVPVAPSLMLPTPSTPPQLRPFDIEAESFETARNPLDDLVCVPPVLIPPPPQLRTPERSPSAPTLHTPASPILVPPTRASTPSPPPQRERERDRPLPSFPRHRTREERAATNQAHAERRAGPSAESRGRGQARGLGPGIGLGRGRERERGGWAIKISRNKPDDASAAVPGTRPLLGPKRLPPQRERERGRQLPSPSPPHRALSKPSLPVPVSPVPASPAPGSPVPGSPSTIPSIPSPIPSPPPRNERSHSIGQVHATNEGIVVEETIESNVLDLSTMTPQNLSPAHNSPSPASAPSSPPSPVSLPLQLERERSPSKGPELTITTVAYQATEDQNYPNGVETPKKVEASPPAPSVIGRATPLSVVISILIQHGSQDLTDELDPSAHSEYPITGGGFGDVYKGRLLGGTPIAIKRVRISDSYSDEDQTQLKSAAREIHTWSRLEHRYVSKFLGLALFRGKIAMISPWAERGSLPTYLAKRPTLNRPLLCTQMAEGLAFLHRSGVVHGDLKGANVLVSDADEPLLADFGNSVFHDPALQFTKGTTIYGITPRWAAPELFDGRPNSAEADVYALGKTILEIITGKIPHAELNNLQFMRAISNEPLPKRPEEHIPSTTPHGNILWWMLLQCWASDPKSRPTAVQVQQVMAIITPEGLVPRNESAS